MVKVYEAANELALLIENSSCAKDYARAKAMVESSPSLAAKIKEFKRAHLDYQAKIFQNLQPTFEEERYVSNLYTELSLDTTGKLYLESEKQLLEMIMKIQTTIDGSCKIDMNF